MKRGLTDTRAERPTLNHLRHIGQEFMRSLEPVATYHDIARELGVEYKQAAYLVEIALGKFVYLLMKERGMKELL